MSQSYPPPAAMPARRNPAVAGGGRSVPKGDMPLTAQQGPPEDLGSPLLLQLNGLYDDLQAHRSHRMEQRWQASVVAEKQFHDRYGAAGAG